MTLAAGTRLGVYEIVDAIGAGGMGEVYRARDTKLRREVAIKILPEAFALDPDRVARFQREAELLASLNHPNIAAVYGIEESNPSTHSASSGQAGSGQAAMRAIVMELVEGATLEEKLRHGSGLMADGSDVRQPLAMSDQPSGGLPIEEALSIACQIVDALEAAHERGVVHRDLKPANIKITPEGKVKVLDFGLAKALDDRSASLSGERSRAGLTASPTLSIHATYAGVILGTAAYMSPEQARGKPVDRRTDIWAFGCVFFEMLAGKQAFEGGETVSDAIAAILRAEIDWSALPADTPPHVRSLLRRCLQKDPQKRLPHIGVVRLELDEPPIAAAPATIAAAPPVVPSKSLWKRALPVAAAALVVGALGVAAGWYVKQPSSPPIARFPIALEEGQGFTNAGRQAVAISPDGTQIAYTANVRLYLRSLSDLKARPIAGTEVTSGVAATPVFSPDNRSIAFVTPDRTLKRIALSGGAAVTVCPLEAYPLGVSWDATGILFDMNPKGILRVSSNGGRPEVVVPGKAGEQLHSPQMLPDGQTVLFTVGSTSGAGGGPWDTARIVAQSLKSGERKTLIEGGTRGRRLEVTGGPVPLVEGVMTEAGTAHYSFSDTGSLVYVPGAVSGATGQHDLALIDRKGDPRPLKLPTGQYETPRVSPDGRQVAFGVDDGKEQMVWVYDLSGTTSMRRLSFGGKNRFPIWSADSQRVAFQSDREGDAAIFWQPADGSGTAERITKAEKGTVHVPESWSPDGKNFLFSIVKGSNGSLWTFSVSDRKATPFDAVQSTNPINATFSPDGRWVAYQSAETGATLIYVQPFPPTGAKYQIPKGTGSSLFPVWSRDGKELFYVPAQRQFTVVAVRTTPSFAVSNPTPLPRSVFIQGGPAANRNYDAARDGLIMAVILAGQPESATARAPQIQVVLNWFDDVKQRVR